MTDFEKFKQLITDFGIPYTVEEDDKNIWITITENNNEDHGYVGFFTELVFSTDGKYEIMNILE